MKKTLLIAAATLAAGIISIQAQVYSQNVVGYVNQTVGAGKFLMAANPLDLSSLPGGNVITNVLSGTYPDSTFVYCFASGVGFTSEQYIAGYGWYPGTTILAPGTGYFIQTPTGSALTNTYSGTVIVGGVTNSLVNGFSMVSSHFPAAKPLGCAGITDPNTTLNFPAQDGDQFYNWDYPSQSYTTVQYIGGYGWYDSNGVYDTNGPVIAPGQGFFIQTSAAKDWTNSYSVK